MMMHEASLIQNLLEIVLESAAANGITRVKRVHLVVGEGHGALPDALDFAFRALSQDTICAGGVLEIETRPVLYGCRDCGGEFAGSPWLPADCSRCGSRQLFLKQGRELFIDYYEGE
ncbi:MAG: hydrogenase maturation nickel metallochaperone HypA [Bacillota bacterium]